MQQLRQLPKPERQRLIASVVGRRRVGSQHELQGALRTAGCEVTQATISRDIRELGLEKTRDVLGRPRYVLAQFGRLAVQAQNIVVVHSEVGSAPAITRALDRVEHAKVVGTLAGDDTCLVVTRNAADAKAVANELGAGMA